MAYLLDNPIQPYAWGSASAIAALLGQPASEQPQAELWMGAHPRAPSRIEQGGSVVTLDVAIAREPQAMLGEAVAQRFGALPFLFKVIAAAEPLSLQVHPSAAMATDGFAREDAAGIPLDARHRNYRDRNHKPELLVALEPFDVLCGFRQPPEIAARLRGLGVLDDVVALLDRDEPAVALRRAFEAILAAPDASERVVEAIARASEVDEALQWTLRLGQAYPRDPGVAASLMLHYRRLAPGEGIYLDAGRLHAYLRGVGVEIMASSDNVLRGGLTKKHVDVRELMRVLSFAATPIEPLAPEAGSAGEAVYRTPAPEFRLSRVSLAAGQAKQVEPWGPEILLCLRGRGVVGQAQRRAALDAGHSVFLPASAYELRADSAIDLLRATVGRTW